MFRFRKSEFFAIFTQKNVVCRIKLPPARKLSLSQYVSNHEKQDKIEYQQVLDDLIKVGSQDQEVSMKTEAEVNAVRCKVVEIRKNMLSPLLALKSKNEYNHTEVLTLGVSKYTKIPLTEKYPSSKDSQFSNLFHFF